MPFERFTETDKTFKPRVTVRKSAQLSFSQGAVNKFKLGEVTGVVLYFDPDKQQVGIQPTDDLEEEGALALNRKGGNASVAAAPFLDYYDIDYGETRRFAAHWDAKQGMLVVALDQPL